MILKEILFGNTSIEILKTTEVKELKEVYSYTLLIASGTLSTAHLKKDFNCTL